MHLLTLACACVHTRTMSLIEKVAPSCSVAMITEAEPLSMPSAS
jgi:hypothetical protein